MSCLAGAPPPIPRHAAIHYPIDSRSLPCGMHSYSFLPSLCGRLLRCMHDPSIVRRIFLVHASIMQSLRDCVIVSTVSQLMSMKLSTFVWAYILPNLVQ